MSQSGFELANGLPFVASDVAVHRLLDAHSVAEAEGLGVALGRVRRASGHFRGQLLAIDPHRVRSYTKRQMRRRQCGTAARPFKAAQTFFCLDADTTQPVCFTTATAARTVSQATPALLGLAADILGHAPGRQAPLVVADSEHFTAELLDHVAADPAFDLLVPMPAQRHFQRRMAAVPPDAFVRHWAGYATAAIPYQPTHGRHLLRLIIQRTGETPADHHFKGFVATAERDDVDLLTRDYPERWHVEEFFNTYQDMGTSVASSWPASRATSASATTPSSSPTTTPRMPSGCGRASSTFPRACPASRSTHASPGSTASSSTSASAEPPHRPINSPRKIAA